MFARLIEFFLDKDCDFFGKPQEERFLSLEVSVDGAFGDAGPMCNIFDKRGRKTFCFKFVECCIQNASAAVFRFFSHMRCPVSPTLASCREGLAVY